MVKNLPARQETQVRSLGQEDPLEKRMVIHFSILARSILWTEELGGLQSMGSQRAKRDLASINAPFQYYSILVPEINAVLKIPHHIYSPTKV